MDTFKKRQKEMQRLERQREKAAKRFQKKNTRATEGDPVSTEDAPAIPLEEQTTVEPAAGG